MFSRTPLSTKFTGLAQCKFLDKMRFIKQNSATWVSVAYNPLSRELEAMVQLFAVSDNLCLFTQIMIAWFLKRTFFYFKLLYLLSFLEIPEIKKNVWKFVTLIMAT